jgi:hypothetical protein
VLRPYIRQPPPRTAGAYTPQRQHAPTDGRLTGAKAKEEAATSSAGERQSVRQGRECPHQGRNLTRRNRGEEGISDSDATHSGHGSTHGVRLGASSHALLLLPVRRERGADIASVAATQRRHHVHSVGAQCLHDATVSTTINDRQQRQSSLHCQGTAHARWSDAA